MKGIEHMEYNDMAEQVAEYWAERDESDRIADAYDDIQRDRW